MSTSPKSEFPVVIAFRACASGFSYSLVYYQRSMRLAQFKQGELWRFLHLDRKNLCRAFGEEGGNKIWHVLGAMRNLKRK